MSQVGKLKAPAQMMLAQTQNAAHAVGFGQQRRHMHGGAAMPAVRQIHATQMVRHGAGSMQRWMTSNAKQQAAAATNETAAPSTAASASSSSSSSGLLLAALLGAGGLLMLGSSSTVHAEAAIDLPSVPLGGVVPATQTDGATAPSGGEKKKKKKKRAGGVRKPLAYPGKLANLSRDASSLVQVGTSQGLRMQFPVSAFSQMAASDKQCMFIPVLDMGGPNGSSGQLIIHTHLGRAHKLEAVVDTMGNVIGSYKYAADNGFSVKPTVQVTPNGNGFAVDMDYKGKEFALAATIMQMAEATLSYCRSLTPTIAAGVELHYAAGAFTNLNGAARYTSLDGADQLIVSKKDAKYTATYYRRVDEAPHIYAAQGMPPVRSEVGVETFYNVQSQKSDVAIGLRHTRHTFSYHASLSASPLLSLDVQMEPIANMPSMKFGINAAVPYDGSAEPAFGLSFMWQPQY